jgi:SOS-response transcriptional repressor LexA
MDTLENTYYWLQVSEYALPQHALVVYIDQLHTAVINNLPIPALALMDEVKETAAQVADALVQAYVHLECARANYNLARYVQARQELEQAIALLTPRAGYDSAYKHCNAIAHWMLGNLLRETPDQRSAVITAWQTSLNAFTNLAAWPSEYGDMSSGNPVWYSDRCVEMRQAIEELFAPAPVVPLGTAAPGPLPLVTPPFPLPISTLFSGKIRSIPVVGEIPAGGFAPSGIDPYILENLPLQPSQDLFSIGGIEHRLVNLRGSPGVTELVSSSAYYILHVNGDSMNACQIDPGDYVLIRQQDSADQMDIVAAEIVNVDITEATLKRYRRTNGMIILEPDSTNPAHQQFQFGQSARNFFIRGVALGVFKPA